jgi:hypothetical protein
VIAADFLGDPTGTRVGHAISRCSGEVETSNASDPLQEDRVALQTVVSAMVRKLVMIVGSGMGLGIDDHRRLFRRGVERVASRSTAGGLPFASARARGLPAHRAR